MIDVDALSERFFEVCYQHVSPHMDKYEAEPDLEKCLPLMKPEIFAAFAYQACCDTASLVTALARQQYEQYAGKVPSHSGALQELAVEDGGEEELRNRILASISPFNDALNEYAPALQRFHQSLAEANDHTDAFDMGLWAGQMFGGLAGVLLGAAGGVIRGAAKGREVEAEAERLHQAFGIMLKAYDRAMNILINGSVHLLVSHHKDLIKFVGAA